MSYFRKHWLLIGLHIIIVILLFFILCKKDAIRKEHIQRDLQEQYPFTSPIIDCQNTENNTSVAINSNRFRNTVDALEEKYQISRSSIYYRDLSNGQWVGTDEREVFSPASMMKTPVFIAFLRQVERQSSLLEKKVVAEQKYFDYEIKQNFESASKIELGKTYTLQQVAEIMIEHSDNVATLMLSSFIKEEDFNSLFKAVGVEVEKEKGDALVRIKDFAAFFRILYNASYLNRDMSEFALGILARTTFKSGLVAGVPVDVPVAHKYGERMVKNIDTKAITDQQLHDCGIVYHPKSPYILCVMTQFFRILYNASYLNRDMSEFALGILARTTFKSGLVAGVPVDVPVAHKYGERMVKNIDTKAITDQQLHDCGIVYHPKSPYILCVMTQGKDYKKQMAFIEEVSRYVYKSVSEYEQ